MKMLTFFIIFYEYCYIFSFFMSMYYLQIVKIFNLFPYLHVLFIYLLNIVNNIQCVNIYFLKTNQSSWLHFQKDEIICICICVCMYECVFACVCVHTETGPHSVQQAGLKFTANILPQPSECCVAVFLYKLRICGLSLFQEQGIKILNLYQETKCSNSFCVINVEKCN